MITLGATAFAAAAEGSLTMEREDIEFRSDGVTCRGWLYLPDERRRVPSVVMAHGLSGVKEMDLPPFAERFAAAGLATLLFDYRTFGASDGEPRGQLFPHHQVEDCRNAISFLQDHPRVDAERIGAWGTSFSGGHVLHLGAYDRRVKNARFGYVPASRVDVSASASCDDQGALTAAVRDKHFISRTHKIRRMSGC
jgi:dipeptidyl aminopeptidase/acylaminoacyl peptidase